MIRTPKAPSLLVVTSIFAVLAAWVLVGCGGGVEVAAPTPDVNGTGLGQATLDGVDKGQTEQVTAIIAGTSGRTVAVTGEIVTFDATGFVRLQNYPLTLDPIVLVDPADPTNPFTRGADQASCEADPTSCDYWVEDANAGVLGRRITTPPSAIPLGVPLTISYSYTQTLLTVVVDLAFAVQGENIRITAFNLATDTTGPLPAILVRTASAPTDGSWAFDARVQTGLLRPTGRQDFVVVDGATANSLTITGADLSNVVNPCIQGRLTAGMEDSVNPDPLNPVLLEVTFDDSDC